jgi:hypothetical protein
LERHCSRQCWPGSASQSPAFPVRSSWPA